MRPVWLMTVTVVLAVCGSVIYPPTLLYANGVPVWQVHHERAIRMWQAQTEGAVTMVGILESTLASGQVPPSKQLRLREVIASYKRKSTAPRPGAPGLADVLDDVEFQYVWQRRDYVSYTAHYEDRFYWPLLLLEQALILLFGGALLTWIIRRTRHRAVTDTVSPT